MRDTTLERQASRTGGAWARGVVARYRASLAEDTEYEAIFAQALEHHARSGMPFELARTQLCYGQRLRRTGRRIDARAQLRAALATFDRLRAAPWSARAERELAGSGEHVRRGDWPIVTSSHPRSCRSRGSSPLGRRTGRPPPACS